MHAHKTSIKSCSRKWAGSCLERGKVSKVACWCLLFVVRETMFCFCARISEPKPKSKISYALCQYFAFSPGRFPPPGFSHIHPTRHQSLGLVLLLLHHAPHLGQLPAQPQRVDQPAADGVAPVPLQRLGLLPVLLLAERRDLCFRVFVVCLCGQGPGPFVCAYLQKQTHGVRTSPSLHSAMASSILSLSSFNGKACTLTGCGCVVVCGGQPPSVVVGLQP